MTSTTGKIAGLLLQARFLRTLRLILFVPAFYFLSNFQPWQAFGFLSLILLIGYYTTFQLRHNEVEKPFYLLWFQLTDMSLAVAVFGILLWREHHLTGQITPMLLAGTILVALRTIIYPIFTIALLREGKKRRGSFWSKACALSIIGSMMLYVLNLENYQEIGMGIAMMFMTASAISFLYTYYRDADHRKPLSISNQLTLSRIVLTPVFIWVFCYDNDLIFDNNHVVFQSLAILMVVAFMVTDFLDGYLARKWGEVSTLGKYLDPFSDKISNMTIFLCFMVSGYASIWMVALIYFREASVETLRTLAANQNLVMPARKSGKWKTALQGTGILVILIFALQPLQIYLPHWSDIWRYLPYSIMGLITFVTALSGLDYFWASRDILKRYV